MKLFKNILACSLLSVIIAFGFIFFEQLGGYSMESVSRLSLAVLIFLFIIPAFINSSIKIVRKKATAKTDQEVEKDLL